MIRTVCVDFDGVIHAYRAGWQGGVIYDDPVPGAFDALRILTGDYAVVIFTTRCPAPVCQWLDSRGLGIPVVADVDDDPPEFWNEQGAILVTQRKLPAVAYIDDRAIRFTSWDRALADLAGLS